MKKDAALRILSWNINGFTKANLCIIQAIFCSSKHDAILFQETKVASIPLSLSMSDYEATLFPSKRMNHGGTLAATRSSPLSVVKGLGLEQRDDDGRVITLEFDDIYLVNAYFPFAGDQLVKLDSKLAFLAEFEEHAKALKARKPVVICGDLNIAHRDIDRTFGSADMPGFSAKERGWLSRFLDSGFVDAFRFVNGDARRYSGYWYGDKSQADRLDYSLVSKNITERMRGADILNDVEGSDHWPITLELS
jgi:exodeoxyribonuclease-3